MGTCTPPGRCSCLHKSFTSFAFCCSHCLSPSFFLPSFTCRYQHQTPLVLLGCCQPLVIVQVNPCVSDNHENCKHTVFSVKRPPLRLTAFPHTSTDPWLVGFEIKWVTIAVYKITKRHKHAYVLAVIFHKQVFYMFSECYFIGYGHTKDFNIFRRFHYLPVCLCH